MPMVRHKEGWMTTIRVTWQTPWDRKFEWPWFGRRMLGAFCPNEWYRWHVGQALLVEGGRGNSKSFEQHTTRICNMSVDFNFNFNEMPVFLISNSHWNNKPFHLRRPCPFVSIAGCHDTWMGTFQTWSTHLDQLWNAPWPRPLSVFSSCRLEKSRGQQKATDHQFIIVSI